MSGFRFQVELKEPTIVLLQTGQKGEGRALEAGQSNLINGLDHPANECFEIEFDYL